MHAETKIFKTEIERDSFSFFFSRREFIYFCIFIVGTLFLFQLLLFRVVMGWYKWHFGNNT